MRYLALVFLAACSHSPILDRDFPFMDCRYFQSRDGSKQWEDVRVVGEYSQTQWLVQLDGSRHIVPLEKTKLSGRPCLSIMEMQIQHANLLSGRN